MKRMACILLLMLNLGIQNSGLAEVTVGKYAGDFMAIGVGARPLAMGGAFTAMVSDITGIYWNPAGLARMKHGQAHVMHSERFAGIVNWDFLGAGIRLDNTATIGFAVFRLGVDGVPLTRLKDPDRDIGEFYFDESGRRLQNTPYAYKYVNPNDLAFVGSYGRDLGDRLSVGINTKLMRRSAASNQAWGVGFDVGALYRITPGIRAGAIIRDVTTTVLAWNGGRKELIVPHFQAGVAYEKHVRSFAFRPVCDLIVSFDDPAEAHAKIGSLGVDVVGGIETSYMNRVAIRAGSSRGTLTAGAGFQIFFLQIDYGFQTHSELGATHRVSLTLTDIHDKFNQNQ